MCPCGSWGSQPPLVPPFPAPFSVSSALSSVWSMRCCARAAALHLGGGGRIPGIAAVTEESAAAQRARRGGMNAAGSVPGPVGGGGKQPQQQLVLFPFDSCRVSGSLRVRLWAVLDDSTGLGAAPACRAAAGGAGCARWLRSPPSPSILHAHPMGPCSSSYSPSSPRQPLYR